MSYLVANPKDRFSHDEAHMFYEPTESLISERSFLSTDTALCLTMMADVDDWHISYLKRKKK